MKLKTMMAALVAKFVGAGQEVALAVRQAREQIGTARRNHTHEKHRSKHKFSHGVSGRGGPSRACRRLRYKLGLETSW